MYKPIKFFIDGIREHWGAKQRWRSKLLAEEPEKMEPCIVYLIGENEPWAAIFLCPCGCKQSIWLNLVKGHRPLWKIRVTRKGIPTAEPSINRQVGCRSHFWLKAGRIIWHKPKK